MRHAYWCALLATCLLGCSSLLGIGDLPGLDGGEGPDGSAASSGGEPDGSSGSGSGASSGSGSSSSAGSSGSSGSASGSSGGSGSTSGSSGGEPQPEASAFQDASPDVTEASLPCLTDLSNVGAANFHVVFDVATTSSATTTAVVNQRTGCSYGTYWDVRMSAGQVFVEMDDGTTANYTGYVVASATGLNDGRTHSVNVSRVSGVLAISVDGTTPGTHAFAASIGALPAIKIAQDACTNAANGSAIVTNLCITRP